jgi:tRNA dimethylallyltransferase
MEAQTNRNRPFSAYLLVGPTAAGKTAVAQWIAEKKGWPILSADSMLVYRGMTVGTAKPSQEERRRVRYWGVDLVNPCDAFNVAMFVEEARRCLESLASGQGLIVAGGTGLYIRALIEGLDDVPAGAPSARSRWQHILETEGIEGLQRALQERNQAWFDGLADKQNPRRLIRALEGHEAGMAGPRRSWKSREGSPLVAGISVNREDLHRRIEERVLAMYGSGLLEETRALLDGGGGWSPTASQAIGYKEAAACLGGRLSRDKAIALTVIRTRQFAKRQMTWFRNQLAVQWIDVEQGSPVESVARRVLETWEMIGATPLGI